MEKVTSHLEWPRWSTVALIAVVLSSVLTLVAVVYDIA